MKKTLLVLSLLFNLICYSQSRFFDDLKQMVDGVRIDATIQDCIDKQNGIEQQKLFMELENTNPYEVKISFKKEIWYNDKCLNCVSDSDEYKVSIVLAPRETKKGSCDKKDRSLAAFVRMLNIENIGQLTDFKLKNIKVEKVTN